MRVAPILLAGMLLSPPAAAQVGVGVTNYAVAGSAPQVCTLGDPTLAPGAQTNFRGLSGATLQVDQLTDGATLATRPASATVAFAATCTYPHRVSLESQNNGLWRTSELAQRPAAGFTDAVPYRVEMSWADATGALEADALARRIAARQFGVDRPATGTLSLRITIEPGASNTRRNAPVVAGYYGDTLRIVLEPR